MKGEPGKAKYASYNRRLTYASPDIPRLARDGRRGVRLPTLSSPLLAQSLPWHERLPKVELHLHLEGAIPKPTLWELITKYGGDPAIKTREDLERALVYSDFRGFLKMWVWMIRYLREYRRLHAHR